MMTYRKKKPNKSRHYLNLICNECVKKIRNALFISTVTPTLLSGKMCCNTKATATVVDIVERKKRKAFNSCFIEQFLPFIKEMHFKNLHLYYIDFPHVVSSEEFWIKQTLCIY